MPDGSTHVLSSQGDESMNHDDARSFLMQMRKHMSHVAQAAAHRHGAPRPRSFLAGLEDAISHIFGGSDEQDPMSALRELTHRSSDDEHSSHLTHEHFLRHHGAWFGEGGKGSRGGKG